MVREVGRARLGGVCARRGGVGSAWVGGGFRGWVSSLLFRVLAPFLSALTVAFLVCFLSAGHGHGHGHGAHDVTYEGLTLHPASKWHTYGGKAFASVMWFWVFYRFYNDFDHFVYGPAAHLEHELHHDAEHAAHH